MTHTEITLPSGVLTLDIARQDVPLDEICAFAVRQNPKRGFLFVSKVLGKHWPVRPSDAMAMHDRLAQKIGDLEGGVWAIGMSETATGLAQGVMQAWANTYDRQAFFQITTRYPIPFVDAVKFEEAHSHAASQYIHLPVGSDAQTVVVIDDEITTGNTLKGLSDRLLKVASKAKRVVWVALKSWMSDETKEALAQWATNHGVSLDVVSLVEGRYAFQPNPNFSVALPANSESNAAPRPTQLGLDGLRLGVMLKKESEEFAEQDPNPQTILMVGVGECNAAALSVGRHFERCGHTVYVQSATRSPILKGEAIEHVWPWEDPYKQGVPHYLYNATMNEYDQAIVVSELHGFEMPDFPVENA